MPINLSVPAAQKLQSIAPTRARTCRLFLEELASFKHQHFPGSSKLDDTGSIRRVDHDGLRIVYRVSPAELKVFRIEEASPTLVLP